MIRLDYTITCDGCGRGDIGRGIQTPMFTMEMPSGWVCVATKHYCDNCITVTPRGAVIQTRTVTQ